MFSLMDMITNPKVGGQTSSTDKASKASKDVSLKGSVDPAKNIPSSSAVAKIQDKGLKASSEAKIQDKDGGKAAAPGIQLPDEPHIQHRDVLSPLAGGDLFLYSIFETMQEGILPFDVTFDSVEITDGPSLACDEGGDTLYKSLISSQVKSLAITHASLRQYRELSLMKLDRNMLCNNLSVLETKVKEKEEALALSEKRVADLCTKKESLCKSPENFKTKVASLDKQIEELDSSLAKAKEANKDFHEKVDAADRENAALAKAEGLRLAAGGSDALVTAVCDSFSFVSTDTTPDSLVEALIKFSNHIDESFWSRVSAIGRQPQSEDSSDVSLSEFATPEFSSQRSARREPPIEVYSSPSENYLSRDSDPLSPVEGGGGPFTFPPGSLVAIGRVYDSGFDASEGCQGRGRRGSRGRHSRGGPSSSRGSVKKRGGRGRRCSSVEFEGPSSSFDAASQVERMISSGVVDPVFQRPYSPSSGYDFDEFGIVCQMLIELGLIVKQDPGDGSP
ncbi:hypothetical protein EJB05_21657, partial [Eragrostis curvula]